MLLLGWVNAMLSPMENADGKTIGTPSVIELAGRNSQQRLLVMKTRVDHICICGRCRLGLGSGPC